MCIYGFFFLWQMEYNLLLKVRALIFLIIWDWNFKWCFSYLRKPQAMLFMGLKQSLKTQSSAWNPTQIEYTHLSVNLEHHSTD